MAEKYQNKYRIPSTRLQHWDYRWAGAYFITICTQKRLHYFGEIEMGKMHLSPVGVIADLLWHEIKNHSKNVTLGEFVVMPNHIHGILVLTGDGDGGDGDGGNVETGHALSLRHAPSPSPSQPSSPSQSPPPPTIGQQRFQNIGKNSVSSIIGGYKSAITKHANRLGLKFAWQPLFYEHIIRDEKAFQNISHYILNNPFNWVEDRFCFKRQK